MRISRTASVAAAAAVLAGGMVAAAAPASAAYGPTAIYQIELSANASGRSGGGVWLWLELSNDGTVDYQGSDCGHGGAGAAHDGGETTWQYIDSGTRIEIDNVILNGLGGFPATVTTPAAYGHYTGTLGSYITLPSFIPSFIGSSQLQVAP
ncbi:MAG TPA: hypothetical protein VFH38_13030 [Jatrophihabitans sp.]|nr:hypothetical protein [Jatrophihabitans sp.]